MLNTAYEMGYNHGYASAKIKHGFPNPYPIGSSDYSEYAEGFSEGVKDYLEDQEEEN